MNPWQMAQQIKHKLEQVRWPGVGGEMVFGAHHQVIVFTGDATEEQIPPSFPFALVGIESGEVDSEDPGLIYQRFRVTVAAEAAGDPMGEHSAIGGAVLDLAGSAGRGALEVAARARAAVQAITGADGAKVLLSSVETGTPSLLGSGRHLTLDSVGLMAVCTSATDYAAPQMLRYVTNKWVWEGSHCAARYDFLRYRLVRKAGTDPSYDPGDGETLYTGTAPQWTGQQLGGTTHTVFADYDGRGNGLVEGTSLPAVGAWRTV